MSKPSILAPIVIVGSAVLFFASIWALNHYYLGKLSVPAALVYGKELPKNLKMLASFKTENDLTADIYNDDTHTKVGFGFSRTKPLNPDAPSGKEALRALLIFQSTQQLDPRLTPFTERYAAAQFDPLRAFDHEPLTLAISGKSVETIRFRTTSEWNHLLGIINLPNGQIAFQAVRKNSKVDPETVTAILEKEIAASAKW